MKSLLLLPMLMLGILFTSCKKEEIIQQEVVQPNRTIIFEVQSSAWKLNNNTHTWMAELPIDELDDDVNQNSGILVYISGNKQLWEPIPDVYNGSTYIYTYTTGSIFLEVQGADGATIPAPNSTTFVKVVLVDSAPIP
ncbi:hypothetical protein [Chitinophaga filiformis]|uniref:BACON domain-containing protein n=1 Tax=Chitinophaga filiformis TaxID=104663 RepID=A0ABY4HY78_CHIFI|nr:hypothetical protein [Chitinophaga filiformis]UPK68793.1 hypothetical protein MYF79_27925 [Chitinophaga filiformis]